ncbi:MAG: hypothetical protein IJM37_01245 [Lachnospiraceae bacterium]|nr:hypothetical protein [Lachnospiraceae bacterium]
MGYNIRTTSIGSPGYTNVKSTIKVPFVCRTMGNAADNTFVGKLYR